MISQKDVRAASGRDRDPYKDVSVGDETNLTPIASKPRSQAVSAGNSRHALNERGADLYQTPPEATRALLAAERIPLRVWSQPQGAAPSRTCSPMPAMPYMRPT
jgi:hypothetical protein